MLRKRHFGAPTTARPVPVNPTAGRVNEELARVAGGVTIRLGFAAGEIKSAEHKRTPHDSENPRLHLRRSRRHARDPHRALAENPQESRPDQSRSLRRLRNGPAYPERAWAEAVAVAFYAGQ